VGLTRISDHQLNAALQNATATASDADISAIATLGDSSTGYLNKTGANTWALESNVTLSNTAVSFTSVAATSLTMGGNISMPKASGTVGEILLVILHQERLGEPRQH
jgi:hypothetical protein